MDNITRLEREITGISDRIKRVRRRYDRDQTEANLAVLSFLEGKLAERKEVLKILK